MFQEDKLNSCSCLGAVSVVNGKSSSMGNRRQCPYILILLMIMECRIRVKLRKWWRFLAVLIFNALADPLSVGLEMAGNVASSCPIYSRDMNEKLLDSYRTGVLNRTTGARINLQLMDFRFAQVAWRIPWSAASTWLSQRFSSDKSTIAQIEGTGRKYCIVLRQVWGSFGCGHF